MQEVVNLVINQAEDLPFSVEPYGEPKHFDSNFGLALSGSYNFLCNWEKFYRPVEFQIDFHGSVAIRYNLEPNDEARYSSCNRLTFNFSRQAGPQLVVRDGNYKYVICRGLWQDERFSKVNLELARQVPDMGLMSIAIYRFVMKDDAFVGAFWLTSI